MSIIYTHPSDELMLMIENARECQQHIDYCKKLEDMYTELESACRCYNYIQVYGITNTAKEEFGAACESFGIHLYDDVIACEGLMAIIKRIWVAIKNAVIRFIGWLHNNDYMSRWFNRNEKYRLAIAKLMTTKDRNFGSADVSAFRDTEIIGLTYDSFVKKLKACITLCGMLNNIASRTDYENFDIQKMFGQPLIDLGFNFNDGLLVSPTNSDIRNATAGSLGWMTPLRVHDNGSELVKLLEGHLSIDRLLTSFRVLVNKLRVECDEVLDHNKPPTDAQTILAKKRLASVICIRRILDAVVGTTAMLSRQWINMTNSYVFK